VEIERALHRHAEAERHCNVPKSKLGAIVYGIAMGVGIVIAVFLALFALMLLIAQFKSA
jgi:hypothetical protein